MKKDDEIKKGLECCTNNNCMECPYKDDCSPAFAEIAADTLTYIQLLEAENTRRNEKIIQLYETIESLNKVVEAIVEEVKATRWISVEERLPGVGEPVLVCRRHEGNKLKVEQGNRQVNGCWKVYGTNVKSVTHWMPLPEPPKAKED